MCLSLGALDEVFTRLPVSESKLSETSENSAVESKDALDGNSNKSATGNETQGHAVQSR